MRGVAGDAACRHLARVTVRVVPAAIRRFLRNRVMWIGFGLAALFDLCNILYSAGTAATPVFFRM